MDEEVLKLAGFTFEGVLSNRRCGHGYFTLPVYRNRHITTTFCFSFFFLPLHLHLRRYAMEILGPDHCVRSAN